jgi:hypothetical protein
MDSPAKSPTEAENRDAMTFSGLVAWAWRETPPVHKNARHLVIHLFAVPLFVMGHVFALASVLVAWWLAIAGILCVTISIALQGFGHSLERQQVHPFTGPRDFLRRLYAEQFFNFWRFLFTGQWYSTFRSGNDRQGVAHMWGSHG